MFYLTAFLTGLISSMHCIGMCGPIAFALPAIKNKLLLGRLAYNIGRLFTYSILGLVFGTFGLGLKIAGLQQAVSVGAGILILLFVIFNFYYKRIFSINIFNFIGGNFLKKLFNKPSIPSLYIIGLLNGLLPCGFVYVALIGASATQHYLQGALFMLLFGLGTLPLMFIASVAGQILSVKFRNFLNKFIPALGIILGLLFIFRGLNLGVPYLSPKIKNNNVIEQNCK